MRPLHPGLVGRHEAVPVMWSTCFPAWTWVAQAKTGAKLCGHERLRFSIAGRGCFFLIAEGEDASFAEHGDHALFA